jgi:multiple sugar transport system permease protein/putative chitobiose transport system permease protein
LVLVALAFLFPLLWAVASSFRPLNDVFRYTVPFSWRALVPIPFTVQPYVVVLESGFTWALVNTLFVGLVTVAAGVLANSLAGFAFGVFRFRGQRVLFSFVVLTFLVPFEAIVIPLYIMVAAFGWQNTFQALIVPAIANGLVIFLFRQFFAGLPRELIEAARVDGLSWFGVWARIAMPLSLPVIVTASMMLFLTQWQSFFWPLLVANGPQYQMVQVALTNFQTQYVTVWNQLFAAATITSIVPVIMLLGLQRYYVQSVAGTGLKG